MHRALLTSVWVAAYGQDLRCLCVFMGQLRSKVARDSGTARLILTEPGVGYRFME